MLIRNPEGFSWGYTPITRIGEKPGDTGIDFGILRLHAGEVGDMVLKVRQYDTLKILDSNDHPQVAAPGYGMYYVWAIRHLPGSRYTVPEFTADHLWVKEGLLP